MALDTKILIPDSDILAAMDRALESLTESSAKHVEEIRGYVMRAFKPNPRLAPIGVAIMYQTGVYDLHKMMERAVYPAVLTTMISNMILIELRKLPGVDDIFKKFEAQQV